MCNFAVAPLAGAWIEIDSDREYIGMFVVAPLAGAWIEISIRGTINTLFLSLPSRERGLKY